MVSLRRLQEVFKMLNCSCQQPTTAGCEVQTIENSVATMKPSGAQRSPGLFFGSSVPHRSHTRNDVPERKVVSQGKSVVTSPNRNFTNKNNEYLFIRNKNFQSSGKSNICRKSVYNQKTNDNQPFNNYINRNISLVHPERVLKVLNRDVKTSFAKDVNEFSRYLPLPAINKSNDNINEATEQQKIRLNSSENQSNRQNADHVTRLRGFKAHDARSNIPRRTKITRQLTYKVLNPLFVKKPSDVRANNQKLQDVNKRSKTVVLNKNQKKLRNDDKGPPIVAERLSKETRRNRLVVTKKLLEAAEKVKEGEPIVESAFWVQL